MTTVTTPAIIGPTTLDQLGDQAQQLAQARNRLATAVNALNGAIEALKAERMSELRLHIEAAAAEWAQLQLMIQAAPQLFVKPRTVSMHGIKFGIEKGKGTIDVEDQERTLRLIRTKLPDLADVLIKTTEVPLKKALGNLTVTQLKSIAVTVSDAADQVMIRPEDGAVDKLVKSLLSAAVEEPTE